MKKTLIILISIIILNCGGGTTNNEVTAITIGSLGNEMKYDTTEFTVNAGATVKLTMKNNCFHYDGFPITTDAEGGGQYEGSCLQLFVNATGDEFSIEIEPEWEEEE